MHSTDLKESQRLSGGASLPSWFSSCTSGVTGGATMHSPPRCKPEGAALASVEKEVTQLRERSAWQRVHLDSGTDREAGVLHVIQNAK